MKKVFSLLILLVCSAYIMADSRKEAKWICAADCAHRPNTWQIFRKKINLDASPDKFEAKIAADSKYWLWVNGELAVFEGGLKRGPAPGDCYYDVVDLALYLRKGENVVAVLTWFFGKQGFSHQNSGRAGFYFDSPAAVSGDDWSAEVYKAYKDTDAPHPNFRLAESNIRFDAREAKDGWQKRGYDDSSMPRAMVLASAGEKPFGKMVERPIPQWKDYRVKEYAGVTPSAEGDTLCCLLPYNCQMTPCLTVEAEAGKVIGIITDNYRGGSENNVRAEYVTRSGRQQYESYGWMNGHRVYYIIPKGVKVLGVGYRETGYDAEFSGAFDCDDPFLNELWKRSARTLYITMRDNYMDCPDRERAQWWGDEVNELGETFYALSPSAHRLASKGVRELMAWQRSDGTIFSPCPAGNWDKELPLQMLASVGWYGFYTQYYYSGDSSFVADIYAPLHRYLHEVWQTDDDGFPLVRRGGWSWGDWGTNVDLEALTVCWYYLALKAEREFALMLGRAEDAHLCLAMMQKIKANFDKRYWNGAAYRSPSYKRATDDRTQAMAVLSGLAGADRYPAVKKVLAQEHHASPYMEKYVLEALCVMGAEDAAIDRMKLRYKKMLAYDYTTLFEGWGIGADGYGGGTINHAWSGGPLTILSQKICGIFPTSPAFRTFRVAPRLAGLKRVNATVETIYGKIKVSVRDSSGGQVLRLDVPKGTTAEVPLGDGTARHFSAGRHRVKLH